MAEIDERFGGLPPFRVEQTFETQGQAVDDPGTTRKVRLGLGLNANDEPIIGALRRTNPRDYPRFIGRPEVLKPGSPTLAAMRPGAEPISIAMTTGVDPETGRTQRTAVSSADLQDAADRWSVSAQRTARSLTMARELDAREAAANADFGDQLGDLTGPEAATIPTKNPFDRSFLSSMTKKPAGASVVAPSSRPAQRTATFEEQLADLQSESPGLD